MLCFAVFVAFAELQFGIANSHGVDDKLRETTGKAFLATSATQQGGSNRTLTTQLGKPRKLC